jgi:hypothetical protein
MAVNETASDSALWTKRARRSAPPSDQLFQLVPTEQAFAAATFSSFGLSSTGDAGN